MKISLKLKPSEFATIRNRLNDAIREINPNDSLLIQETDKEVNEEIKRLSDILTKRISKLHQNDWE